MHLFWRNYCDNFMKKWSVHKMVSSWAQVLLFALLLTHYSEPINAQIMERKGAKVFSLFNVVRFPNIACSGTSDTFTGVCLTSTECTTKGGKVLGGCASGFGACCLLTVSSCGAVVTENCTYIQNPGYPSKYDGGDTTCNYEIKQCASDICFLRLDFDTFSTGQPSTTTNLCLDKFTVTAAAGTTKVVSGTQTYPPIICGENAGQHMYIDAGRAKSENILISHSFSSTTTFDRKWNIKVTQIPCDSLYAPPSADCLQYFTGLQDTIYSYNFGAPSSAYNHLSFQEYRVCIRQAPNRCGVFYFPTTDEFSFRTDFKTANGKTSPEKCTSDYVIIPRGTSPGVACTSNGGPQDSIDRFCAAKLSCATGDTEHRGVLSTATPFGLYVVFDDTEAANELSGDRGFALNYRQELC